MTRRPNEYHGTSKNIYGISMEYLWNLMGYLWSIYKIAMEHHWVSKEYLWNIYGMSLDISGIYQWNIYGISIIPTVHTIILVIPIM